MKWIDENVIPGDPLTYMQLLEEKGIHCKSSGEFMRSPYSFADRKGVWIVFERQYADAIALLGDQNHIVEYPLTEEDIREIEMLAKKKFNHCINKFLSAIAFVVLSSILAGFCYFIYTAI